MKKYLRSSDLARMAGISAQQIRNYEAWGFLPTVPRGTQGYRQYTPLHVRALQVVRKAIEGIGWQNTGSILRAIHTHEPQQAMLLINAHHAKLYQLRQEIETMLKIVRSTANALPAELEERARKRRLKYVHEAANAAGVRVSTVRFWEARGLLHPQRDKESRYRLYDPEQIRRLQIVALLRRTGYDFIAIEAVLQQLSTGTPEQAIQAAEQRLQELTGEIRRCVEATSLLWEYSQFYEQHSLSASTKLQEERQKE